MKVWDLEDCEELRALRGHTRGINAISVTPDGRHAVSASHDTKLKVWDLESGEALATLEGHADGVVAVAVTPDGRYAISGAGFKDDTIKVWDLFDLTHPETRGPS
jgi:WD40 repeat protein